MPKRQSELEGAGVAPSVASRGYMTLSRDQIRQASDIKTETVSVPEWGGDVIVRGMSGAERDAFEQSNITGKGKNRDVNLRNYRAKLVIHSCVDESGNRLFSETDAEWLGSKAASALSRIVDVASRLSGISDSDQEELVGELKNDQLADSPSV